MTRRFLFVFSLFAALALAGCATGTYGDGARTAPVTYYLVRHAEKDLGTDPDLTRLGRARATVLSEIMEEVQPALVYSTNYNRTRQTAAPAALALGLPILYYDPSDLEGFAERLKVDRQSALIVGHSNTTPPLVAALGGDPDDPINEASEYDRLYEVTLSGDQVTTVLRRYGAPYTGE